MEQRIEKAVMDKLGPYKPTVDVSRVGGEIATVFVEVEYPINTEVVYSCSLKDNRLYVDSFTARCDRKHALPERPKVAAMVMNDWRAIWTVLNELVIE